MMIYLVYQRHYVIWYKTFIIILCIIFYSHLITLPLSSLYTRVMKTQTTDIIYFLISDESLGGLCFNYPDNDKLYASSCIKIEVNRKKHTYHCYPVLDRLHANLYGVTFEFDKILITPDNKNICDEFVKQFKFKPKQSRGIGNKIRMKNFMEKCHGKCPIIVSYLLSASKFDSNFMSNVLITKT